MLTNIGDIILTLQVTRDTFFTFKIIKHEPFISYPSSTFTDEINVKIIEYNDRN